MMLTDTDRAETLVARLIAHRFLPRSEGLVRRVLADDGFRADVDARLASCGLKLLDNPFASHIGVSMNDLGARAAFGQGKTWLNNNSGLTRDQIALLVVIWALIVLPKRERQLTRASVTDTQADMFGNDKPIPQGEGVSMGVSEDRLLADFGSKLGGKTRISFNLPTLARLDFIERRNKMIFEGPLLDLAIDYSVLAPRILEGALADMLAEAALIGATQPAPRSDSVAEAAPSITE